MGKKSSSQPSQADPLSPSLELPRMDPPPPYETISRSSTSSSVRSLDHLDPDATGPSQTQQGQTPSIGTTRGDSAAAARDGADRVMAEKLKKKKSRQGGGCCNYGNNVDGCMNYGDNADGCLNYGDRSNGCLNYESPAGCMNYRSTGGCMNYEVNGDWEGNEGCSNYGRGGGCCLFGDR